MNSPPADANFIFDEGRLIPTDPVATRDADAMAQFLNLFRYTVGQVVLIK